MTYLIVAFAVWFAVSLPIAVLTVRLAPTTSAVLRLRGERRRYIHHT